MTTPIPSYANPPLNEVFLSVQFEELKGFNVVSYGALWELYKDELPVIEQLMPVMDQFEKFGARRNQSQIPEFSIQLENNAPLPRAWFISSDNCELIQIQTTKFIRNWRRSSPGDAYPRYEHMRSEFISSFQKFSDYADVNFGGLSPNQCEIRYINHVDAPDGHSSLSSIFNGWSENYGLENLAETEEIRCSVSHVIRNANDEFLGRLHISIQPAYKIANEAPIYLIELTVRGMPQKLDLAGIIDFMDMGREKIVRAFTLITTKRMHDAWERER